MSNEETTEETKALALQRDQSPAEISFDLANRKAKALALSGLMPTAYSGPSSEARAKCLIAVEMADRMQMNPMSVAQNLHIIKGKPSWSSSFVIAAINHSGKFSPLRFKMGGEGQTLSCTAWAKDREDGEVLEGPPVTMEMAQKEGWSTKSGSKWKTMPELMIRYRAAAFFGRLYAPELLAGLHHTDEIVDSEPVPKKVGDTAIDKKLKLLMDAEKDESTDADFEEIPEGEEPESDLGFDPNDGTDHIE